MKHDTKLCGVKIRCIRFGNYAEFVPMNGADDTGHVGEMTNFLNGEAASSAKFAVIGDSNNPTGYTCEFYVQNNMYLGSQISYRDSKDVTTHGNG